MASTTRRKGNEGHDPLSGQSVQPNEQMWDSLGEGALYATRINEPSTRCRLINQLRSYARRHVLDVQLAMSGCVLSVGTSLNTQRRKISSCCCVC